MVVDLIGSAIFSGAMAMAVAAIWGSVAPQWHRIVSLAGGQAEPGFYPVRQARGERGTAVRGWTAAPAVAPMHRLRAA